MTEVVLISVVLVMVVVVVGIVVVVVKVVVVVVVVVVVLVVLVDGTNDSIFITPGGTQLYTVLMRTLEPIGDVSISHCDLP